MHARHLECRLQALLDLCQAPVRAILTEAIGSHEVAGTGAPFPEYPLPLLDEGAGEMVKRPSSATEYLEYQRPD